MTKQRHRRVFEHILFWLAYWLLECLAIGLEDQDFLTATYNASLFVPITIAFSYLYVYLILPLFFSKKYVVFALLTLAYLVTVTIAVRLTTLHIAVPWLYADSGYSFSFFHWVRIVTSLVHQLTMVGIVAGFRHYRKWRRTTDKMNAMKAEKREAELSFLKAQIHPHFLFNTLNSIYYEALRKSNEAPDLIIRLSDILRFTLYECRDPFIPIAQELQLIENYIALETSRYRDRLTVNLLVSGPTEANIPPLICFSLIENAFKHGASENTEHSLINIAFEMDDERLRLEVVNPIAEPDQADVLGASKGIGLENVRRQLGLIFEKGYRLENISRRDRFICTLEMPLSRI